MKKCPWKQCQYKHSHFTDQETEEAQGGSRHWYMVVLSLEPGVSEPTSRLFPAWQSITHLVMTVLLIPPWEEGKVATWQEVSFTHIHTHPDPLLFSWSLLWSY